MKAIRAFLPFWNCCALTLFCALVETPQARGWGVIYNPTQADLEYALIGGGTATFACSGTIVLTNTITISADTILDGNGYNVTISGGNAVRIFQVAPSVSFWIKSLTLSDGRVVGANGADGAPPSPGQDALAGAILSQGGTITLTSCVLSNNSVQAGNGGNQASGAAIPATGGAAFGGALYVSGGSLNMTNCRITGNTITSGMGTIGAYTNSGAAGDAGDAAGGAIYLLNATATLQNVVASGNGATGAVGTAGWYITEGLGSRGGTAAGGLIYATNSTVTVANSTLSSNLANGGGVIGYPLEISPGSGSGLGACLFISGSSSAVIQFSTLTANAATGGNGYRYAPPGAGLGGAVYNLGSLQVLGTRFTTNQCFSGPIGFIQRPARGGAIYSEGPLIINECTLNSNAATGGNTAPGAPAEGGAIWTSNSFSATNCTFTINLALGGSGGEGPGGGPSQGGAGQGGGIMTSSGGTLINLTLSGNNAVSQISTGPPGPAQGGGLAVTNTSPTLRGTIIANSPNGSNVWGVITDGGYNICSDGSAGFSATGSQNNTDPMLDVLANNGGPTPTMALLSGSPALDIIPSGFPATDQRGVLRPQGPRADAGAYERTLAPPPPLLSITMNGSVSISFTAQGGSIYRLLSSTDFVTWTSVATNSTLTNGPLTFGQGQPTSRSIFYRVVSP